MATIDESKRNLRHGKVYRRADLAQWSSAVDRHTRTLLDEVVLSEVSGEFYRVPRKSRFGNWSARIDNPVTSFRTNNRYLMIYPDWYDELDIGTTRFYDCYWIYKRQRHGKFKLGNLKYNFILKPCFPPMASKEYLLVHVVHSIDRLAEYENLVIPRLCRQVFKMDTEVFAKLVGDCVGRRAKRLFKPLIGNVTN